MDQIRAIERELRGRLGAVERLDELLRKDPSALDNERLKFRDYRNFRDNLELTYLIRLFAEFEAGLREAWESAFRRTTHPKMADLIESIATQRLIPQDWRDHAHEVRKYRNTLVHERGDEAGAIGVRDACGHLCRFFSRLPHDW